MKKPIVRVVIDTNVVVSAFYFPESRPGEILALAREGSILNIISKHILEEVRRILGKKLLWSDEKSRRAVEEIISFSEIIKLKISLAVINHLSDNRILECAVTGQAHYIISGDRHLTSLRTFQDIKIVAPATFLALLMDSDKR